MSIRPNNPLSSPLARLRSARSAHDRVHASQRLGLSSDPHLPANHADSHQVNVQSEEAIDISVLFPEEMDQRQPPRLVGTETLPKLDVKAVNMQYKLDRIFDRFENFFDMNSLTADEGHALDAAAVKLKSSIFRQYIGDPALNGIRPLGSDQTKTYEELKAAIVAKYKPAYSDVFLRSQFFRCTMMEGQSLRDFLVGMLFVELHARTQTNSFSGFSPASLRATLMRKFAVLSTSRPRQPKRTP